MAGDKFPCALRAFADGNGQHDGHACANADKASQNGAGGNGCEKFSHGNASNFGNKKARAFRTRAGIDRIMVLSEFKRDQFVTMEHCLAK